MTRSTVLVAAWQSGLYGLADKSCREELPGQSIEGLARDSSGNALAIVGGKSTLDGGLPRWLDGISGTGNIAASGSTVAVIDRAGTLYESEDVGGTWSRRGDPLPIPSCILIV